MTTTIMMRTTRMVMMTRMIATTIMTTTRKVIMTSANQIHLVSDLVIEDNLLIIIGMVTRVNRHNNNHHLDYFKLFPIISNYFSLEWKFLFVDHRAPPIIGDILIFVSFVFQYL